MEHYGELLKRFRRARGISQRALARAVGLNPTLLNRSEAGDRPPAGPAEIAAIARALELTPEQHDQLLASAGYWPAAFLALGAADRTLRAVALALADETLPEACRQALRQAIEGVVEAVRISCRSLPAERLPGTGPPARED